MLNPPLSLLPQDVIDYLVEHVASIPFPRHALHNLSLADPAFTEVCQKYIFRTLILGRWGNRSMISRKLKEMKRILDNKPLFANQVRTIRLLINHRQNAWLFQNPCNNREDAITFISILQLLAKSPMPPNELHIEVTANLTRPMENPILVVEQLSQSFFSQTLTILHLSRCENVPLPLFLLCPRLKEVYLNTVGAIERDYDNYPDEQCSGRVLPALELFNYRRSQTVVKQMITPPSGFHTPVVLWSKLRILTLPPHEAEGMACLQPILEAACNSLEELYLSVMDVRCRWSVFHKKQFDKSRKDRQIPLAGLINLSRLLRLRVFALHASIKCDTPEPMVLRDIITVLGTIPASNSVTNICFEFRIFGEHPFCGCLDEDWVGICNEVVRISSGKLLELDMQIMVDSGKYEFIRGADELYGHIIERTTSLSNHSQICTHFRKLSPWIDRYTPSPCSQVRSRCRR